MWTDNDGSAMKLLVARVVARPVVYRIRIEDRSGRFELR
jgi:hypothetical protein